MVASLTGQFSSQGTQALKGAIAWVKDVNRHGGLKVHTRSRAIPLYLRHYDDQSSARIAATLAEKLIVDDAVHLLLGPYSSVLTLAVAPVAERYGRVLWNHGGASDQIYTQGHQWIVGVLTPASRYLTGVLDLVRETDPEARKVAILRSARGAFPPAVASGVESHATESGFEIVLSRQYPPNTSDFSPYLREIEDVKPDIILGVGRIQDDLALASQLVSRSVQARATALVAAGISEFGESLGISSTGFLGPSQWESGATYRADYGPPGEEVHGTLQDQSLGPRGPRAESVDYPMVQAYAAGLVAQRCIEETGTMDNAALRETADRLDFTTFYGRFKLEPGTGRQVDRSVVIVQWQGNEKVIVWPKDLRQAEPLQR